MSVEDAIGSDPGPSAGHHAWRSNPVGHTLSPAGRVVDRADCVNCGATLFWDACSPIYIPPCAKLPPLPPLAEPPIPPATARPSPGSLL